MSDDEFYVCHCSYGHEPPVSYEDWRRHYFDIGLCNKCIAFNFGRGVKLMSLVRYKGDPLRDARDVATREKFPVSVPKKYQDNVFYKRLGDHGEWQLASEMTLPGAPVYLWKSTEASTETKLARLRTFHAQMRGLQREGLILAFDRDYPPMEGAPDGGWAFVPRLESEADFIVRMSDPPRLTTTEDLSIWLIPPQGTKLAVNPDRIKKPNVCGHPDG